MGLFNNKDKGANTNGAFNSNYPQQDQSNANTYPYQRFNDWRDPNSGGANLASGSGNADGYSVPNQAGVRPYDNNNATAQWYAGAGQGAQQDPRNFANTGAGAGAGAAGYVDQQGAAATGGGRGGAAAGYNPTGQVTGHNQAGQSTAPPSKSDIQKDEWLGKFENIAGILMSSESMKQRGAAKEMEAVRLKKQSAESGGARGVEPQSGNMIERAVGYGARLVYQALGAGNSNGGPGGGMSGTGMGGSR